MNRAMLLATVLGCFAALGLSTPIVTDHHRNITYTGTASNGVENFQDIRYGQETSGERRFKHPQAFLYPSHTQVNATSAGAACPQDTVLTFLGVPESTGVKLSEDCLNLRIARPAGTKATSNLPVLVWIVGGEIYPR